MTPNVLDEREFELINIIGSELNSNQRELSRHMDLSLGTTNMLIRRLVSKGYIRISQLNKRKVSYILTPKGFAEKLRKSIKYTLKTMSSISLIKEGIKTIVFKLYQEGNRNFVILGKSDFALLIEMVFKEMNLTGYTIKYIDEIPTEKIKGTLLVCREDVMDMSAGCAENIVNLVYELAENNSFVQHSEK